ncbi:DMT family transporter [Tabrizicola sp.]|uniref:DMT family transporter n=1 Tax=Tabrizicola sp. TaxID=2005166 RepID=UPI00286B7AFF|nr:DMT family transporter [Tabrizicola sp.]
MTQTSDTPAPTPAARDNLRGSLLMTAAMAGFAVEDMFIKSAAKVMPLGQILLTMGIVGVITFALMARAQGEAVLPRAFLDRAMLVRSCFEVVGRLFYGLSIALTALSTTSAILQATPLLVVAAAAVIFGEKVGWQRWLAVVIGFVGVLIILRPGMAGFSPLSLLAVVGLIGFAGRDLATRAAPKGLSNRQLGTLGFAMLGTAGAILLGWSGGAHLPDLRALGLLAGASVFGILGYHALTGAMRTGEVSVVTPFRYTRLVFAMILAMAIFGERPDTATWVGAALVVASGIYTLTHSRAQTR